MQGRTVAGLGWGVAAVLWGACAGDKEPIDRADPPTDPPQTTPSTPSETDPESPPIDTDPEPPPIDDDALFDPDHLVEIDLTLDPEDWEALRGQTRTLYDLFLGPECLAAPFPSPFTYFPADLVVDDEAVAEVGLRKKGLLGSLSTDRPSLKIKTDAYVDDQLLENGTERITLNNGNQDPGRLNACLGYGVFAAAGLAAPRCNFAHVTVNGEDLGVYVHVEAVKRDFLRRHFDSAGGDLYEGTLSDFADGWLGTFEAKTDDTDPDKAPLHALAAALDQPDDQLLAALDPLLDLDRFVRFWATESLLGHWDGYGGNTNNYFVYRDPSGDRISFLPWGADALFEDPDAPAVFLNSWLTQRLWGLPEVRAAYLEALDDLLATAFDEPALLAEVDRMAALIGPHALDPGTLALWHDQVRAFVSGRRAAIAAQRAALDLLAVPDEPPDASGWCLLDAGGIAVDFATTWDTLEADPFAAGTATLSGDALPPLPFAGAIAGPDAYGTPILAVLGVDETFTELVQVVVLLPDLLPGPLPLGLDEGAVAYVLRVDLTDPYDEGDILGIVDGTLDLSEAGAVPGAPVAGTLEGTLLEGLF